MLSISDEMIYLNQSFSHWKDAIVAAGAAFLEHGYTKAGYTEKMIARQEQLSVYIGNFVALPHGDGNEELILKEGICFFQVPDGVNFGTKEEPKIATLIFAVALKGESQLQALQDLAFLCSDIHKVMALSDGMTIKEIQELLLD